MLHFHGVTAEKRQVVVVTDGAKTVTFHEPVVWLDAPAYRASKGVRLPAGSYVLEAEDPDYYYFRAPAPIEMRVLKNGAPADGRDIPGGVAIAKAFFSGVGAVTYVDAEPGQKLLVMKLGSEFMQMRGRQWDACYPGPPSFCAKRVDP